MRAGMAGQAALIDNPGRRFAELEDLRYIAATFNMLFCRSVTALARDSFAAMHQGEARMRILSKLLGYVLVAGLTGFRAYDILRFDCAGVRTAGRLLLVFSRSAYTHGLPQAE